LIVQASVAAPAAGATLADTGLTDDEKYRFLTERAQDVRIQKQLNDAPEPLNQQLHAHPNVHQVTGALYIIRRPPAGPPLTLDWPAAPAAGHF